ncbi:wiskott-Aldrich syndrome protein homolog 1-like [Hordeum vulgare subsp. vulgare]|uniref:wiskott-Aldrich syndrome protein homolog 1-like n=1 Tax=Hordeum vulgare subsp. vulgare TaxID=112509 RepID=UPI001D1A5738|nr:wiskott-Aldrich syndrome protein homolog 1-like [Hordeum vulgare subsp. vulgare]
MGPKPLNPKLAQVGTVRDYTGPDTISEKKSRPDPTPSRDPGATARRRRRRRRAPPPSLPPCRRELGDDPEVDCSGGASSDATWRCSGASSAATPPPAPLPRKPACSLVQPGRLSPLSRTAQGRRARSSVPSRRPTGRGPRRPALDSDERRPVREVKFD